MSCYDFMEQMQAAFTEFKTQDLYRCFKTSQDHPTQCIKSQRNYFEGTSLQQAINSVTTIRNKYCPKIVGQLSQSVQRLATGWTVRDQIPVGTRFSARPDWVFPGGKVQPGHAADCSPPSSAAVMEEQSYTSTHPLGHTRPVTGSLYLYLFYCPKDYFTTLRRNSLL